MEMLAYDISRKTASKLLRVTSRSIDRYIRAGKLSARRIQGRIWLSREDLISFQRGHSLKEKPSPILDVTENFQKISSIAKRTETPPAHDDLAFYRQLYAETLRLAEEKDQKLQMANYRIGQLERPSEPREQFVQTEHQELLAKIKRDKFNHGILVAILYVVLLLQPVLWYFLKL